MCCFFFPSPQIFADLSDFLCFPLTLLGQLKAFCYIRIQPKVHLKVGALNTDAAIVAKKSIKELHTKQGFKYFSFRLL